MTKPMLTGYIKEHPSPSWLTFNLLLETVNLDKEFGHLFVVDIKFHEKRSTEREYKYNEILPPIIEKQTNSEAYELLVYQLLELMQKTSDGVPKTYRCTKQSHATMFPKTFILFYLEDLSFLIKICCLRVMKIYNHYTFKQARFKRNFVLINQKSGRNAKNAIKKDFFKLMNSDNFGFDCKNNFNNVTLEPIIDEISEIFYIKKILQPY